MTAMVVSTVCHAEHQRNLYLPNTFRMATAAIVPPPESRLHGRHATGRPTDAASTARSLRPKRKTRQEKLVALASP